MKLPFSEPEQGATERIRAAKAFRDLTTEAARTRPHALTKANGEEDDHTERSHGNGNGRPTVPANFTKGLLHDEYGLLAHPEDYRRFVEAINASDRNLFETCVHSAVDSNERGNAGPFHCVITAQSDGKRAEEPKWRGWESPRAGHVFDLEGPDAGAVGMAPAPRVGSSELAAEMAEVYSLALLRDVPFTTVCEGGDTRLCPGERHPGKSVLSAREIVDLLNNMPFYSGNAPTSSTPRYADASGLNRFERNRRFARTQNEANPLRAPLTPDSAFRGSTTGALDGPYISQFMLVGSTSRAGPGDDLARYPDCEARFDFVNGYVVYGSQIIDQRTLGHKNGLDHMTDWASWLDVQNGADFRGMDQWEPRRRYITTPRDLATYVHFDASYQGYLNAALILLSLRARTSKGFPEPSPTGKRDAFATFGGPHLLSLLTEGATRCLKAVRRQKFNYHRRARPEALAGRLTLSRIGHLGKKLGCAEEAFAATLAELPEGLLEAVVRHNNEQNARPMSTMRRVDCPDDIGPQGWQGCNLLLPMAFPEGSPMHPAYGAGHAAVAGGCVTLLKAFFEMYEDGDGSKLRVLETPDKRPIRFVPDATGETLVPDPNGQDKLTIQGELDKLAANISIGRNMAGVHYYSDYYDSLRMAERVAVGILLEQAPSFGDGVEHTFDSFDGDRVTIYGSGGSAASLTIVDRDGTPIPSQDWWLRHVSGKQTIREL